ncbi:MAG: hypothetical protein NVSMB6_21530 [Burkholderiaceae bacterium]
MNAQIDCTIRSRHVFAERAEDVRFHWNILGVLVTGFIALLCLAHSGAASAATAPNLGTTSTYGIVSGTFTNSNTSPQTIIQGDVCFSTGPTTPPLTIAGVTRTPCPPQTGLDQGAATANANGQLCTFLGAGAITLDSVVIAGNPPGTIPPGCYTSGGAMLITATTNVTLSGSGVYLFRPGGALTTGANSNVILTNGACASDVFWVPVGATTLGANAALSPTPTFSGNILDAAGITIGHFANLTGRALAFGGTVTTDAVTITVPTCTSVNASVGPAPMLSMWVLIMLAGFLAIAGIAATRRLARQRK